MSDPTTVEVRLSKDAIRAIIDALPRVHHPEVHDALSATLRSPAPFVELVLAPRFAGDLLEWLGPMADRRTREHSPSASVLIEAAQSLRTALDRLE